MLHNSMAPANTQPQNLLSVDIKLLRLAGERMARITLKKSNVIGKTSVQRIWDALGKNLFSELDYRFFKPTLKKL